jgi:magnesium chelatase accessory protein
MAHDGIEIDGSKGALPSVTAKSKSDRSGPDWRTDGAAWPNRSASRFVEAAGRRWHVQIMGRGPVLLLLHGTGASTHSWRGLLPLLAKDFTTVAPDLPGHGFSDLPPARRLGMPEMAADIRALLDAIELEPVAAVGHSAGAAILARMSLDHLLAIKLIVSINGALLPFQGVAGQIFSPLAKLLYSNPLVPHLFAWRAGDQRAVERVISGTGSKIDAHGVDLYARLFTKARHVSAALGMMGRWQLDPLRADLGKMEPRLLLVASGDDRAIPPEVAFRVRELVPDGKVEYLRKLGHLAHEEDPQLIARLVKNAAQSMGLIADGEP